MQGFTNVKGELSLYQQSIPILERIAGGNVSYWKFGNDVNAISRTNYLSADKTIFYPNSDGYQETRIQKVLEKADPSHVTVIVTDLFQEFADINQLISLIRQRFIKANVAVGIMGIRSQFDGTVYDVGTNDYDFPYRTGNDPKLFRPFYIIVLGSHAVVNNYFDKFDKETAGFQKFDNAESAVFTKQRVIFSRHLVEDPAALKEAKVTPNPKVGKMAAGFLVRTSDPKNAFREFSVESGASGQLFKAEIPVAILSNGIEFGPELTAEIQSSFCSGKPTTDSGSAITAEASLDEGSTIVFTADVDARKIPAQATSVFRIVLRPASYRVPKWIDAWNMSGEDIERWKNAPNNFQGMRTHNLTPFVNALWAATEQEFRPMIADFYCYMKRG